ncbi:MAG: hypothetical protein K8S56_00080 [Candidatus Cloacimonetes bacterium]|nr:hypothetical protein [Candidatus Cloacimonadota bacterium]
MFNKLILPIVLLLFISCLFPDGVPCIGSGTQTDPYQVATLDNLLWVSTTDSTWANHFIQTADIDARVTSSWSDGRGFGPIGIHYESVEESTYDPFVGSYDGQNFIIDSLNISLNIEIYNGVTVGMFGVIDGATIQNCNITNIEESGMEPLITAKKQVPACTSTD